MSLTGTLDMLWEDNERLRARVESQRQVIEDLRRELENACQRIAFTEKALDAFRAIVNGQPSFERYGLVVIHAQDGVMRVRDMVMADLRKVGLERGSEDGA